MRKVRFKMLNNNSKKNKNARNVCFLIYFKLLIKNSSDIQGVHKVLHTFQNVIAK